ncbi:MAG: HAMP domain-containing histidine kinase [Lachnospiraceae bacterium]|nr:HAMP domain-containing histidine kinase [Lachnospiraceae bacterium]
MSSIQTQNKRMSSITGRLHHTYMQKKIGFYLKEDLLAFFLMIVSALFWQEYQAAGSFEPLRIRMFDKTLKYTVTKQDGALILSTDASGLVYSALYIVAGLLALQFLLMFLCWFAERRRIMRILSPLMDIALKADELNRMSFGEDKYGQIENAIERIQVDQSEMLSFGDKDLRGIEAAMNNLLRRMREANMQQARFVNDASHELRTPIAVLQGYADMLARWGKEDEKVLNESIEAIRNEAAHMSRLVEQLLFLARGDSGRTKLQPEKTELTDFMREIYEESLMIDEKHIYRYAADSGSPVYCMADKGLLKQAVRILVDNAAKYTGEGDEIMLSAGKTWLQVQDTGRGIQESDVAHIFDRFYRSEDVRSFQGTGLGLSIAKWIIDKHGAHFEVLSRKDLGTRIRIVLPETDPEAYDCQA